MRRFDKLSGLVSVWGYARHIIDGAPLMPGYAAGRPSTTTLSNFLYPWDLEVLTREIILHGGTGGEKSLTRWNDLAAAINFIRRLDDHCFSPGAEPVDMMLELHRMAHRQFPWQSGGGMAPIMRRAFKVFGRDTVESIVLRELGMTTRQFMLLGAAIAGNFQKASGMSTNQNYACLGISLESSRAFFDRVVIPIDVLRSKTAAAQSYDRNWLYSWNPLEGSPLISFDRMHPDRVICPISRYLTRRTSSGLFYDLVNASNFDNSFGNSFQSYVGEVLAATCSGAGFTVLSEEPYYIGNNRFDGLDWILSDTTGHVFIEAKTKRLTLVSRMRPDTATLGKDLLILAKAVVQHYRNIIRALEGKSRWINDGQPVHPLVLTLEDLFIITPTFSRLLHAHIVQLLDESGVSQSILDDMPYTIASVSEFEATSQILSQVGIRPVFSKKTDVVHRSWSLLPFVSHTFPTEMKNVDWRLFAKGWAKFVPEGPEGLRRAQP
jgi:hypothetical protein